jgi:hypothetical protein
MSACDTATLGLPAIIGGDDSQCAEEAVAVL